MKNSRKLSFVLVVLLVSSFLSLILKNESLNIAAEINNDFNTISSLNTISNNITVTSFDDFQIYNDSNYIDSINSGENIVFSYNGSADFGPITDNYILKLDAWGNCSDFEFYSCFNYTLNDVNDMITFRMMTGSYYKQNGEYIGLPDRPKNEVFLCSIGISDAWSTEIGHHVMYIYPYDVKEKINDNYGDIGFGGDLQIKAIRKNNVLTCQLYDLVSKTTIFSNTWDEGVDKPINYLLLDFYTGQFYSNVSVNAYDLNTTLFFDAFTETSTIIPTLTFPGYTTTMVLLLFVVYCYVRKKPSNKF